jgi:hypothetical protein
VNNNIAVRAAPIDNQNCLEYIAMAGTIDLYQNKLIHINKPYNMKIVEMMNLFIPIYVLNLSTTITTTKPFIPKQVGEG